MINSMPYTFICKVMYAREHFLLKYSQTMIKNMAASSSPDCCPLAKASQLLGDMWVLLIVNELLTGAKRYGELETALDSHEMIGDISSRTLCQRLKHLEEEKIIVKKMYKEVPPRSEYSLTEKGSALSALVEQFKAYGVKYLS